MREGAKPIRSERPEAKVVSMADFIARRDARRGKVSVEKADIKQEKPNPETVLKEYFAVMGSDEEFQLELPFKEAFAYEYDIDPTEITSDALAHAKNEIAEMEQIVLTEGLLVESGASDDEIFKALNDIILEESNLSDDIAEIFAARMLKTVLEYRSDSGKEEEFVDVPSQEQSGRDYTGTVSGELFKQFGKSGFSSEEINHFIEDAFKASAHVILENIKAGTLEEKLAQPEFLQNAVLIDMHIPAKVRNRNPEAFSQLAREAADTVSSRSESLPERRTA